MELTSCKDCHELAQALREHVQRVKDLERDLEAAVLIEDELVRKCEEFEQQVLNVYEFLKEEKERVVKLENELADYKLNYSPTVDTNDTIRLLHERIADLEETLKAIQDRMLHKSQIWELIEDVLKKEK